jgi:hypothetical protein
MVTGPATRRAGSGAPPGHVRADTTVATRPAEPFPYTWDAPSSSKKARQSITRRGSGRLRTFAIWPGVLSLPLQVRDMVVGALNVYAHPRDTFR